MQSPERKKKWYEENREVIRAKAKAHRLKNKEKINAANAEYREKYPERVKESRQKYMDGPKAVPTYMNEYLKRNYKITLEEYNEILRFQNEVCRICKKPDTRNTKKRRYFPLVVDHNHKTGEVRGLLCSNCNTALGLFNEDENSMSNAISYLREFNSGNGSTL
jgi:hypothetical protein